MAIVFESLSSPVLKLGGQYPFLSAGYLFFFCLAVGIMALYAVAWQLLLERLPLTTAYLRKGLTYVLISHNVSVIRHMSDRVAVMYLGQIVELGDAQQVLTAPAHPYTRLLLDSLPAIDKPLEEEWALRKTDLPGNRTLPQGCFFYERCPLATHGCEVRQSLAIREDGRELRCWRAL